MVRAVDFTKDWQEIYQSRLISVEEAAKLIKSGDVIDIPFGGEPRLLYEGLAARMAEVKDVRIRAFFCSVDAAIYDPAFAETFKDSYLVLDGFPTDRTRPLLHARRSDFIPALLHSRYKGLEEGRTTPEDGLPGRRGDILLMMVEPPDKNGFCSLGQRLYYRRNAIKWAKTVIAEVTSAVGNPPTIRPAGDSYIHVSEIDYFVENRLPGIPRVPPPELSEREMAAVRKVAQYVSLLLKDGDCFELGMGGFTTPLAAAGVLDGKVDMGWHSENTAPFIIRLIKQGVITGKRKTIDTGKAVTTALFAFEPEEIAFIANNPAIEVRPAEYVDDPRVIAQIDNMVAINSATMIDLSGQISAESIGPVQWSAVGGQFEFVLGALMSKGGRSIHVFPSTAAGGRHSRIVGTLPAGTIVTVPRTLADTVITEWGIARLWNKSCRERAKELIAVAHPDFRAELKKEAEKLFYP